MKKKHHAGTVAKKKKMRGIDRLRALVGVDESTRRAINAIILDCFLPKNMPSGYVIRDVKSYHQIDPHNYMLMLDECGHAAGPFKNSRNRRRVPQRTRCTKCTEALTKLKIAA